MTSKSKRKGYRGEKEVESLLAGAERDFGAGDRPDVRWGDKRVEVKRRAKGFREDYKWLRIPDGAGKSVVVQGENAPDILLKRADNMPWLLVMPVDEERLKRLVDYIKSG